MAKHFIFSILFGMYMVFCFKSCSSEPVCKVYSYTKVDCANRNFKHVPPKLPSTATHLDISSNVITSLPSHSFEMLTNLIELDLSSNWIAQLSSDSLTGLSLLETLDLRSNRLFTIPDRTFSSLKNLNSLNISVNLLVNLSPLTFHGLSNLQTLELGSNFISELSDDAFQYLTNLKHLYMESNMLSCFPYKALLRLTNIEVIFFDLNVNLGNCSAIKLQGLRKLRHLSLSSCGMHDDSLLTFEPGDAPLQELDLTYNDIKGIASGTFTKIRNIPALYLARNTMTADTIETSLYDFQESDIKVLSLDGQVEPMLVITNTTFKGLETTLLEELYFPSNDLLNLPDGVFQWLPQLKLLDLSRNNFNSLSRRVFAGLHNLTTLRMEVNHFQNITELLQSLYELPSLQELFLLDNQLKGEIPAKSFAKLGSLRQLDLSYNTLTLNSDSFNNLSQLQTLDLSQNSLAYLPHKVFSDLVSLKSLNLKGNELKDNDFVYTNHPFDNLARVTTLKLSNPRIQFLHLEDLQSLQVLNIFGSDYQMEFCYDDLNFNDLSKANLSNLAELYIHTMCITTVSGSGVTDMFPSMRVLFMKDVPLHDKTTNDFSTFLGTFENLQEIYLKYCEVRLFEMIPYTLSKLHTLDLSHNSISHITSKQIQSHPHLRFLNIQNNLFHCSDCKMKDFVEWMKTDDVIQLKNAQQYSCASPISKDGTLLYNLAFGLECNLIFMVAIPVSAALIFLALCISLCIYFRWRIRYLIFQIKLKFGGYEPLPNEESAERQPLDKQYDAFVCYNKNDRSWVMQQLVPNLEKIDPPNFKLCLHERDFIPGMDNFENILESIEKSHKTMLILSPGFAQSEWCYFEMRMALDKLFTGNRDVLLLVMLEDIPDDKLPRVLRTIFLTRKYIKWPENESGRQLFWEELKVALRSDNKVNRVTDI
ncbi:toll-like receptor 2 type-2 [Glandiceps talaboti]